MNEQLPDSGGAYFDEDSGGLSGVVSRTVGSAKASVTSGELGAKALAFAVGGVVTYFVTNKVN